MSKLRRRQKNERCDLCVYDRLYCLLAVSILVFISLVFCYYMLVANLVGIARLNPLKIDIPSIQGTTNAKKMKNIIHWQQDPWEATDSERIFTYGSINGKQLNARQWCSAESAAKHNRERTMQILVALPAHQRNKFLSSLILNDKSIGSKILQNYPNIQIVLFNETEYFKNTVLMDWYNNDKFLQSRYKSEHISVYTRLVSLFRGGGLFIDLDSILTIKPITASKWKNFFVRSRLQKEEVAGPSYIASSKLFHLVYGHSLSDDLMLNMAQTMDNTSKTVDHTFAAILHASMANICLGQKYVNQCSDVKLLDHGEVFLPRFAAIYWSARHFHLSSGSVRGNAEALTTAVQQALDNHQAPFFDWKSFSRGQENRVCYRVFISALLKRNCPVTYEFYSRLMLASK